MRLLLIALLLGSVVRAQEPEPKTTGRVVTPLSLPGAEAFIYHDVPPEPMRLHVFKPKGWKATDRRPALIHFFGGGFVRGAPTQSAGWARQAAKLGMIGIAADYRVFTRHGTDATACLADARAAMHWLQAHAADLGLDPQRIVVSGSSAGGLLALWTAIKANPPGSNPADAPLDKPATLILMWPAADLLLFRRKDDPFAGHARACSGTQNLDARMPPVLLLHGDADPTVPYRTSVELHRKLTETGNSCEFITMPGNGHGTTLPEWKEKLPRLIQEFLTGQKILPVQATP
jgi:acetyl esterase